MTFAAVDVETANPDFASICQIGIVTFEGERICDEWQTFIDPEDHFDPVNVSVHGIRPEHVNGAPRFPDVHRAITDRIGSGVSVCHTAFDRVSLERACHRYGLSPCWHTWLDSARVARRAWPDECGRGGYGLAKLSKLLSLTFEHHVALEDARAAGWVVLRAVRETGHDLDAWLGRVKGPIFAESIAQDGNSEGPLAGETIAFTGALRMTRAEAAAMAAQAGCDVGTGVTKATTILVVGDQDASKLAGHEKSAKHRKAETLVLGGQQIRVIGESDFGRLLSSS